MSSCRGRRAAQPAEDSAASRRPSSSPSWPRSRRSCAAPRTRSPPRRPSARQPSCRCRTRPIPSAPDGSTDEDAQELRRWGDPAPEGPEHTEIGRFELERAARLSGARFGYLAGDTALLGDGAVPLRARPRGRARAYAADPAGARPRAGDVRHRASSRPSARTSTRSRPTSCTSRAHPRSRSPGSTWSEILDELPLRYAAFSTCFRRESGAAGKDTRGHVPRPPVQQGRAVRILRAGSLVRGARPAARDRGGARAGARAPVPRRQRRRGRPRRLRPPKKYDIEAWFPSQQRYREITSTSNTTDFQARRLGIRYRAGEKRLETPHTLNGTAVTDRWLLALLENFRGEVPDVLRPFGAPERVSR